MRYKSAFAFETIQVLDKPVGLLDAGEEAFMTLQGSDIRYRYDGGEPTQIEGHLLISGNSIRLHGMNQVNRFRAISVTDKEGILSVSHERD